MYERHQYKARRSPSHIRHLLPEVVPMQDLSYDAHSLNADGLDIVDTSSVSPSKPHRQLLKRNVSLLSFRI